MAVTINASTSAGLVMTSDLSGVLTLQQNGVALPNGGVAPAFSAYMSANQTISSGVSTKIAFDTKSFDTNSNYNTTNYRFTPAVAGYYQITVAYGFAGTGGSVTGQLTNQIYKNGSTIYQIGRNYAANDYPAVNNSILLYLNGTDYIEVYGNQTATASGIIQGGLQFSSFSACLVRGA